MEVWPVILRGSKVELAPMELEHSIGLYEAGRYPDIWTFTQGRISLLEDSKEYIRKALESEGTLPFVIIERASGKIVGSTRFYDISVSNRSLEIGSTWLTPTMWRTPINTDANIYYSSIVSKS